MRQCDDFSGYPDKPSGWVIARRLAWPTLFSVAEVWAVIVVLTQIRVAGVQAAALAIVVSGVVLVMWSEWYDMREILRWCNNRPWTRPPDTKRGEMSADLV